MLLLQQMFILFMLMMVGFICKKTGIITTSGSKVISGVVVNVANPALILSAGINKKDTIEGKNLILTVILAVGIYVFLIVCAKIVPKVLRIPKTDAGTYEVMTVFSNIGFMGFPVISAVYGNDALLYASFFLIPYNVLIYTWGIVSLCSGKDSDGGDKKKIEWSRIFNIGVIACLVTIVAYMLRLQLPGPITSVVDHLSELTAPLSMMVIGASMTDMNVKELISDVKLLLFMFIKLLIIPVVGVSIIKLCGIDMKLVGVCLIMLATPVGSMTAMLSQQYDADYELASKGVALSTVLSVVTIPLLSFLLKV